MNLENLLLLKIPFVSKKRKKEMLGQPLGRNKYSYEGFAYYLVDPSKDYGIVWQRAKFISFEYKSMNEKLKKNPTIAYKRLQKKGFDRESIFPINKDEVIKANKNQIDQVNKFIFREIKTALGSEGVITGSNPTGSNGIYANSPFLLNYDDGDNDYLGYKQFKIFINSIKKIYKKNKEIENIILTFENIDNVIEYFRDKKITLKELMRKNIVFSKNIILRNNLEENYQNIWKDDVFKDVVINNGHINKFIKDEKIKEEHIKKETNKIIIRMNKEEISKDEAIVNLRALFRKGLLKKFKKKEYRDLVLGDLPIKIEDAEAAHIISIKEIKERNLDYSLIADKNNGLLLSPTIHSIFDKNKISFDKNGIIIIIDKNYSDNIDINKINLNRWIMNKERINNFKIRNKNI